ncbi:MAG: hypothetical protein AAFN44_05725 [Pseudomonadota bacterium]
MKPAGKKRAKRYPSLPRHYYKILRVKIAPRHCALIYNDAAQHAHAPVAGLGRAPLLPQGVFWDAMADDQITISMSSSCRLFDFSCNAAIGLLNRSRWSAGTLRQVMTSDDHRVAMVKDKFGAGFDG